MRKMFVAAFMGLVVAGSALSPVSAAENETYVSNDMIVDPASLSNQNSTTDDTQNSTPANEAV